jgi:hypothetical protein
MQLQTSKDTNTAVGFFLIGYCRPFDNTSIEANMCLLPIVLETIISFSFVHKSCLLRLIIVTNVS